MTKKKIYDNYFNKTNSLIKSISKLFITMLILLGITTFVSAFKEVAREVTTCLDEKFSLVLYSVASRIDKDTFDENNNIDKNLKTDIDGFIVGKYGFNAILKVEDGDINTQYITKSSVSATDLEQSLNEEDGIMEYIYKSEKPSRFMSLDFSVDAKNIKIGDSLYRIRVSNTGLNDYYILTASGQDEYLGKMARIIFNSILLTLIFTPILIHGTKKMLKVLSEQIKDLNVLVQSIITGKGDTSVVESLCSSKNEIGVLANSIKDLVVNLEEKSKTDELTGIGNRRKLYECLDELNNKERKSATSIVFVDIDYFKKFNDGYGHLRGDIALKSVAKILKESCLSRNVLVTRYGGEEFVMVCPEYKEEDVIELVKEIQVKLDSENIEHKYSDISDRVTLSIGIATVDSEPINMEEVLLKADEAVYEAKESGRNRYAHKMIKS